MKQNRLDKIKELILENRIETQEELCKKLLESGYEVTQATISRDIRKLHLTKVSDKNGGKQYYTILQNDSNPNKKFNTVLQEAYISITSSMNLIVIRTVSGMAMAFAAALDSLNFEEILGSVAGDDTVICVVRDPDEADIVITKIKGLLS